MTTMRIAVLAAMVLAWGALGCGNGNDNQPRPQPTAFTCSGPEGPPNSCGGDDRRCCGNQCIDTRTLCCTIPAGHPDAGNTFVCARGQKCCEVGCVQAASPCT